MENRGRARTLQTVYTLWRLADTPAERQELATLLDSMLNQVLRAQAADGAYRVAVACGGTMQYMDGMLNDVLIDIYTNYRADARIPVVVRKNADYLWTQWRPAANAFQYVSNDCPGVGFTTDLWPVLNQLIVNTFAWTYKMGGGDVYRQRADAVFAAGVHNSSLQSSKEFNQQYNTAYKYLSYRR
jgi:hypothetical protein